MFIPTMLKDRVLRLLDGGTTTTWIAPYTENSSSLSKVVWLTRGTKFWPGEST